MRRFLMELRCYAKGSKCPPYVHEGVFVATNATLRRFEPDLKRCARCTAWAPSALPSLEEELLQIARITLWQKGPAFNPNHERKASFRTYILPWICGAVTRGKKRELQHYGRVELDDAEQESPEADGKPPAGILPTLPDKRSDFVDTLIWELWNADFEKALPHLLKGLTKRELQVFSCTRANMKQVDIAEQLGLSAPRISQLLGQVERKLTRECRKLRIIE